MNRGRLTRVAPAPAPLLAVLIAAGVFLAAPAFALVINDNVAFTGVNLSPWDSGPAIDLQNDQTLSKSFNVDLPGLNTSPVQALSDFLGVPLPLNANVSIGAHTDGTASLDFGYAVTSGNLNLNYPAIGSLQIPTAPGTDLVAASQVVPITTAFQPGLKEQFLASTAQLVGVAGNGYAAPNIGVDLTKMQAPVFSTTFPYFAAWADASYDVHAGASINADLKVLGNCIVCASKSLTLGDSRSFPIVEVTPGSVKVLGNNLGSVAGNLPIVPPDVSATVTVPNLNVGSAPLAAGSTTLSGSGSSPVIQLNLSLEKLVPAIGSFLSNSIGPFGYNLLSVNGGPNLGVYQDFAFTAQPKVDLAFSQVVLQQGSDGNYHLTKNADFNLGDPLNLEIPWSTGGNVTVQPTYTLDNTFSNETGITFGAAVTFSGLALTSSFGDLGPAFSQTLTADNLVHIPLYNNSFQEPLGSITADPFTIDVGASRLGQISNGFNLDSVTPQAGNPGIYDVRFGETGSDAVTDLFSGGTVMTFCETPIVTDNGAGCELPDQVLDTGTDLTLDGFDFGRFFCIYCADTSNALNTTSPFITDTSNDALFLSDLTNFPTGGCESNIGLCDGTFAAVNQPFNPIDTGQIASVSATVVVSDVPEPASIALFGSSLIWLPIMRLLLRRGQMASASRRRSVPAGALASFG
jgi:hypothetical protein